MNSKLLLYLVRKEDYIMSLAIQKDTVATVHYHGTLTESQIVFDSSRGEEPLIFLVGHNQMIPGFEKGLLGKVAGDKVILNLSAEESYGEYSEEGVRHIPLSDLPEGIVVGDELVAETDEGYEIPLHITAISEDQIATVDMNHELAGEALTFEVEVISVRAATEEEKAHGHAHIPGVSHH